MPGVLLVTGGRRASVPRLRVGPRLRAMPWRINYRSERTAAERLAAEVRVGRRPEMAVRADVAREADVVAMFDEVTEHLGRRRRS